MEDRAVRVLEKVLRVDRSDDPVERSVVDEDRAELEIFAHRHVREDLAAFRHLDEARLYDVRRGCAGEELSVEADLPDQKLFHLADKIVRPKIEQVNQVGLVEVIGGRERIGQGWPMLMSALAAGRGARGRGG